MKLARHLGRLRRKVQSALHEAAKRHPLVARAIGEKPRSSEWPKVEKAWLAMPGHDECAACGEKGKLNVHHRFPFNAFPECELDIEGKSTPDGKPNFITLCVGLNLDHIWIGHGDSFVWYNPHVVSDAADLRSHPERREEIQARAKAGRLRNSARR